jgi:hypothetical protein
LVIAGQVMAETARSLAVPALPLRAGDALARY